MAVTSHPVAHTLDEVLPTHTQSQLHDTLLGFVFSASAMLNNDWCLRYSASLIITFCFFSFLVLTVLRTPPPLTPDGTDF